ncbi:MAG: hypothetical protein WAS36_00325 [Candidatus Saccharimonadales bacterium]
MISPGTQQILRELRRLENNQKPSKATQLDLQNITLVGIVAPSTSGKNMLIDAALHANKSWHYVPSVTTRPKQDRDTPGSYREYIPHDHNGLSKFYKDVQAGKLLQYAIHPETNHIMATYLSDYSGKANLKDMYATSVARFRELGFGNLLVVSLVTPYEQWKPRFDARFPAGDANRAKRLREAVSSSAWSQQQALATDHFYLVNDGTPSQAAEKLVKIIQYKTVVDPTGYTLAKDFENKLRAAENL